MVLLRTAVLVAAALMGLRPAAAQTIELKVSHYLPPNHTVQKVLEGWAAELGQKSGGRLKLNIYPAAQLGPVQRQFDLARNGQADMAVGLHGATPGRYPLTELTSMPFSWPSGGSSSVVTSKRLTELAPKYLAAEHQGLRILWVGVTPPVGLFTAKRPVRTVEDIARMKLRFAGEQHARLLRALDAVPLQVPPGEIADGMSKGVIDGALFNYEAAESFGLGSVTGFVQEPGLATSTLALVMNPAKYDQLPPDLRKLIDDTTGPAAAEKLGTTWDAAEKKGREYMIGSKVQVLPLPEAQLSALKTRLEPLVAETVAGLEKGGKPAKALLEEYRR